MLVIDSVLINCEPERAKDALVPVGTMFSVDELLIVTPFWVTPVAVKVVGKTPPTVVLPVPESASIVALPPVWLSTP